jgi:hypothetical protein
LHARLQILASFWSTTNDVSVADRLKGKALSDPSLGFAGFEGHLDWRLPVRFVTASHKKGEPDKEDAGERHRVPSMGQQTVPFRFAYIRAFLKNPRVFNSSAQGV